MSVFDSMHHSTAPNRKHLSTELLPEHLLAGISVLGETSDTLVELVESHGVVEQGPSERSLVVDKGDLLHLVLGSRSSIELLGDLLAGVLELLKELGSNGEVVATGELGDFAHVSERSTHDNGVVAVLLVVVEDLLDRLDSWVSLGSVGLSGRLLVPVENLHVS